jgi:hypothetical protein
MTHPRDYLPVLDRIGLALESTCDALMTLQSIAGLASKPGIGDGEGDGHVTEAISALRHAVDELREAQIHGQTGLAMGFVLARSQRTPARQGEPGQSSPRRTA